MPSLENVGISKRISRLYSLDWLEIPRGGHSDLITLKGKITKRSQRNTLNYFDCLEIVPNQKFDRLPNIFQIRVTFAFDLLKAILVLVFTRKWEIRKCVKLKLFKKRSCTQMINRCQKDFMLINNFLEINKQIIGIWFKFILTEFLSEWMCHPFLLECDCMCVTLRHLKTICHEPLETAYQYLK